MSALSGSAISTMQREMTQSTASSTSFLGDPEWQALTWGVGGALAFLVGGLIVGVAQGGLLPGECEGLACLFTTVILMYAGIVLVVWLFAGVAVALARRRWPESTWRLWTLRVLAALSWLPFVGLVVLLLDT